MIEGYTDEGGLVLINPRYIVAVFTGGSRGSTAVYSTFWANVQQENGNLHRFKREEAERVVDALRAWREQYEGAR